ncbi:MULTISPECIES: helix-turn-helix domain-containing protein [Paenibacillus]|uniref:helix-turn-helix domain-containing protein n=1 Tax=Paenibacillus TaxID=44249 RepID=UPI00096F553A|nr:XRE family transcriptional regulator [Paenibacillus odorifer]OME59455.1 LexA family transcriptional repressor [Paenibacillus odorifer]
MKLTDKLDLLMEQNNLTRMGLSKGSGVPYMTIVNFYEKGTENVKLSTLRKLADYFHVTLDYLVDDTIEESSLSNNNGEIINLPIYGRICCGNGEIAYEEIEGYEPTPKEWLNGGEYFYLRAKGDSMTGARIYEGDLLLIRAQPDVENGEIAAVLIGDEAVLKRVYKNGEQLVLQAENNNFPPVFVPPSEARILGKLKMNVIKF